MHFSARPPTARCPFGLSPATIERSVTPQETIVKAIVWGSAVLIAASSIQGQVTQTQDVKSPYPSMAPIERYRMARDAEIAMARTAAPASISRDAQVLVLGQKNYEVAV